MTRETLTIQIPIGKQGYNLALLLLLACAAFLRFWHLGELDFPVFDEVYFPNYGHSYLAGTEFFHVHPPLYNYLSAASIWIYYHLPWVNLPPPGSLGFTELEVLSYRWINAAAGTVLVWVTARITLKLTGNRLFSILAALFIAIDGSFVVDSRFGMNNLFLVLFGLLALLCAINALRKDKGKVFWMILLGICLGCSVSVKWNGLGFTALCLAIGVLFSATKFSLLRNWLQNADSAVLTAVRRFSVVDIPCYILLVPLIVYCLLWIPDRMFNTDYSFLEIHAQSLGYHANSVPQDDHPYCSRAWQWPVMYKPVNYYFNTSTVITESGEEQRLKDIHLFGNPALYWFSTLAVLAMSCQWLSLAYRTIRHREIRSDTLIISGILAGYFGNLLPWMFVSRCIFLYHYQSAAVFGFAALAWYITTMLRSKNRAWKTSGIVCLVMIIAAFIYWLPFSLGLELSSEAFYSRMWMSSWI